MKSVKTDRSLSSLKLVRAAASQKPLDQKVMVSALDVEIGTKMASGVT